MLGVNESAAGNSSRAASKTLCARGILGRGSRAAGEPRRGAPTSVKDFIKLKNARARVTFSESPYWRGFEGLSFG